MAKFCGYCFDDWQSEFYDFSEHCKMQEQVKDLFSCFTTTKEKWFMESLKGFVEEFIEKNGNEALISFIDKYGLVRFSNLDMPNIVYMDFRIEDDILGKNVAIILINQSCDDEARYELRLHEMNSLYYYQDLLPSEDDSRPTYDSVEDVEEDENRPECYIDIGSLEKYEEEYGEIEELHTDT